MDQILKEWILIASTIIKDLGFPIFVAVWVLLVQNKTLKELTAAIKCLTTAFQRANISLKSKEKGGE